MRSEPVGARQVHPLGVVPETAVDCWQSAGVIVFFTQPGRTGRVESESVGARQVHPLGVVPMTTVDYGQSAGV